MGSGVLEAFQPLSEEERRVKLRQQLERLRRACPESLEAHARYVHTKEDGSPLVAARHHFEWIRLAEQPEEHPYLALVAPPGYAKSTWWTLAYTSWRVGREQARIRMGIVANSDTLAWGWCGALKEIFESARFRAAYPECVPDYKRGWRHNELFFTNTPEGINPTVAAAGMRGAVQSRRFDEIVLDDPTTYEEALSDTVMEKQRNWLKNTLIKRFPAGQRPPFGKGTRMVVVFTRWGVRDLYQTLEDLGFHVVHMPALGYWDGDWNEDGEFEPGDMPLWPEKEDQQQLLAEKARDPITFELVAQGNPRVLSGDMFDPAWWADHRASLEKPVPDREDFYRLVVAVDTASGKKTKKKTEDYTAICVMGVVATTDDNGNRVAGRDVWILDVVHARINTLEQEDVVVDYALTWLPDVVVIEDTNEGTALIQRLVARHLALPIKPVDAVKSKEYRATPLAGAYRQQLIWHARGKWNLAYESELQAFPAGAHDDMVDAAAHAYNNLMAQGPRVAAVG